MDDSVTEATDLKSCKLNLKVMIGGREQCRKRGRDEDEDNEEETENLADESEDNAKALKVVWYNSNVMAFHSRYIDTLLSTPMKERESLEISFPEIDVETWDLMMKMLAPSEACDATVEDVLKVAKFYDKYEFVEGKRFCDKVLLTYFQSLHQKKQERTLKVGLLVDAVVCAFQSNFPNSYKEGKLYIAEKLTKSDIPFGRTMFMESHIKKLVPIILALVEEIDSFAEEMAPFRTFSKEEIQSPLFPRLYSPECELVNTRGTLTTEEVGGIKSIILSGFGNPTDGKFVTCLYGDVGGCVGFTSVYDSAGNSFTIYHHEEYDNDWVVETSPSPGKVLWRRPYSGHLSLPPKVGWQPVCSTMEKSGQRSIRYLYGNGNR